MREEKVNESLLCRYLVDKEKGKPPADRKARRNAESWAMCAYLLLYTVIYPEFDFSGSVVQRREHLAHHFSGLDNLRHPSHGSIKDLPGYTRSADICCDYDWTNLDLEGLANKIGGLVWSLYAKSSE